MISNPWIDATRPIYPGMPVWPGDHAVEVHPSARISAGDGYNLSCWVLSNHVGTHVDPPLHFIANGAPVTEMSLDVLCGPCRVLDLYYLTGHVDASDLAGAGTSTRLLLKTRNSFSDPAVFHEDFLALSLSAANHLVDTGVRLIGVDGPSIEPYHSAEHPIHEAILGAGIAVIEGLDLSSVEAGDYELVCAPLPWRDGDGSPCRVILRQI